MKSTKTIDLLAAEFAHEMKTTRRHLERVPGDKFDWRPHAKSFTAGGLAAHIVECVGWAESIFSADEYNFDPAVYTPFQPTSVEDLLKTFDGKVAEGTRALQRASEDDTEQPWRLKIKGQVRFEKPKVSVLRDFVLSHVVHHRGQMSVYLRLLDVPVPGSYGPTADE